LPAVETFLVPLVAFPVENPPPVQVVALLLLHVSVEGTLFEGDAERVQVGIGLGAAATVIFVQAPQLSFSLLSVIVPAFPAELLSAHARTYHVPAVENVYDLLAVLEPPAESAALEYVPMSVAPVPLESVARWKRSVNPEPVDAVALETVALRVTAESSVAEVGVMEPAVRFGFRALTESELVQETAFEAVPDFTVTLAVLVPAAVYVLAMEAAVPESESVPLHA